MGALHDGHLSLVHNSLKNTDITVVSVFVNPTQFNNMQDLERYPRNEERDLKLLNDNGCDVVFLPETKEVYPSGVPNYKIDLGSLDNVMEGKFRPGHFKGVAMVVERLFEMVQPHIAFFGEKDFQQLAVIRKMVELKKLSVAIEGMPTVREKNGLAMSSRNERLSDPGKSNAAIIFESLKLGREFLKNSDDLKIAREKMRDCFNHSTLELEYLEIADERSLMSTNSKQNARGFIAAYCEGVRLIDNLKMETKA